MTETFLLRGNVKILLCEAEESAISTEQQALDLIGDAFGHDARVVAIPAQRLDARFFSLSNGIAGAIAQKFVNYRLTLVIVGDISEHLERSSALKAFVTESNRGSQVWFLNQIDDIDSLLERLPDYHSLSGTYDQT